MCSHTTAPAGADFDQAANHHIIYLFALNCKDLSTLALARCREDSQYSDARQGLTSAVEFLQRIVFMKVVCSYFEPTITRCEVVNKIRSTFSPKKMLFPSPLHHFNDAAACFPAPIPAQKRRHSLFDTIFLVIRGNK